MKVYIALPHFYPGPPRLFLHASSDEDREILARLAGYYETTNAGKDGADDWHHVAIELTPKKPTE